jgi:hypothetical protein
VWFPEADGLMETAVYDRYALRTGDVMDGPAVFEETESTFVIGPGGRATVLDDGTIDVAITYTSPAERERSRSEANAGEGGARGTTLTRRRFARRPLPQGGRGAWGIIPCPA